MASKIKKAFSIVIPCGEQLRQAFELVSAYTNMIGNNNAKFLRIIKNPHKRADLNSIPAV
mgnify:FL=1